MEYFIIEEGVMWNKILEVLERKVSQGVDVRLIYDDMGCVALLPGSYAKILEKKEMCIRDRKTAVGPSLPPIMDTAALFFSANTVFFRPVPSGMLFDSPWRISLSFKAFIQFLSTFAISLS